MPGLYLYPNDVLGGVNLNNSQFEQDISHDGDPLPLDPKYNRAPDSVKGTPQDDLITFSWNNKYLYLEVHQWWEPYWAYEVKQRRLTTGETVLEVGRGAAGGIMRVCWDVIDRRTGGTYQETATGVVSAVATVGSYEEQWQLILWRGDYLLRNGVLEASTRGCGG